MVMLGLPSSIASSPATTLAPETPLVLPSTVPSKPKPRARPAIAAPKPRQPSREQVQIEVDAIMREAEEKRAKRSKDQQQLHDDMLSAIFKSVFEDTAFTTRDMERLEYLQPIVIQYRKQMGLLEAKAQAAEESSQQGVTTKRRTDDQGMREKGTKHRTIGETHHGTTSDGRPKSSFYDIGGMFQKGVEEVVSSEPSSATRTPTSIPLTFKESASGLPTEEEARYSGGDSGKTPGLSPTDPRSAKLASDIRSKFEKKSQSTPPQNRGEKTSASTPSSLKELD